MDPQIEFQGIENPTVRQEFKDFLDEIIQLSPSDAAVQATFRFIQNRFLGEIKIASETAYMSAKQQAVAVHDLLEQVKTDLMGQIVDWRLHRFAC